MPASHGSLKNRLSARLKLQLQLLDRLHSSAQKKLARGTVHDLRSTCRRLIAALEVFEPMEIPLNTSQARNELKDLLHGLRDLRDLQVGRKTIRKEAPASVSRPSKKLLSLLKSRERREKKAARHSLASFDIRLVHKRFEGILSYLDEAARLDRSFKAELEDLSAQHLKRRYDEVAQAIRAVPRRNPPAEPVHEVRIRFKRFRYAWEFLSEPENALAARRTMKAFRELQNYLGSIQDTHVLLAMLLKLHPRGMDAYTRLLVRREQALVRRFHQTYPPLLKQLPSRKAA